MKKSIFKTSLLVTLSTLFVACGSHNHTSVNKETQKQPQQSQKPAPQTKPQANSQDKAQQDSKQEKPNNHEQDASSIKEENSTQNHSTEAEKQQKPSNPEQSMNTENSADKKDETNSMDMDKNNSSKNTQSDVANSMQNNHKPSVQENSPQVPPKTENSTNSNNISNNDKEKENQSMSKPKLELAQNDMPSPSHQREREDWKAKIYDSAGYNYNTELDPYTISSSGSIISLQLGENKQDNYEFTLLGKNEERSLYYGHLLHNVPFQGKTIKIYQMFHGINQNQINREQIPSNFNAQYKKDKGFLYSIFSTRSDIETKTHIPLPQYADISITYENGKATGQVTKTNDKNTTLFNITDNGGSMSDYKLTVTPTGKDSNIQSSDKAQFEVYFLDSTTKGDRKYITGSGSSTSKKWGGVFAAEKQTENKPR